MSVYYLYACDTEGCQEFITVDSYRTSMSDSRAQVRAKRWRVTTKPKLTISCPEHAAWTKYAWKGFDTRA